MEDWSRLRRRLRAKPAAGVAGRRVAMACGTLIGPVLQRLAAEFAAETGIAASVHPVTNTLFGERVNVSGLLSGGDFVRTLAGVEADLVLLPRTSLDYFGERFLDSMTVAEVEAGIGAPVAFATSLSEAFEAIQAGPRAPEPASAPNGVFWSDSSIDVPVEAVWVEA